MHVLFRTRIDRKSLLGSAKNAPGRSLRTHGGALRAQRARARALPWRVARARVVVSHDAHVAADQPGRGRSFGACTCGAWAAAARSSMAPRSVVLGGSSGPFVITTPMLRAAQKGPQTSKFSRPAQPAEIFAQMTNPPKTCWESHGPRLHAAVSVCCIDIVAIN